MFLASSRTFPQNFTRKGACLAIETAGQRWTMLSLSPAPESYCHSHSTFSFSFLSSFSLSFLFLFVSKPPSHQVAQDPNTIQISLMIILISFVLLKGHNTVHTTYTYIHTYIYIYIYIFY